MPLIGGRMPDYARSGENGKKSARKHADRQAVTLPLKDEAAARFVDLVSLVLASRGAIFFGAPKNGTALLIRAWIGGDQYEDYCSSEAEIADVLDTLRDAAEAAMMR